MNSMKLFVCVWLTLAASACCTLRGDGPLPPRCAPTCASAGATASLVARPSGEMPAPTAEIPLAGL